MALSAEEKAAVVAEHATCENDTGSPEVQVALLTVNINKLQDHFGDHKERSPFTSRSDSHGLTNVANCSTI